MYNFKLADKFLADYKGKQPNWGPLGLVTYSRTYSRVKEDGTQEEFWETVKRVVEGCYSIQKDHCRHLGVEWGNEKAQYSAQEMFKRIWAFKFLPPGRGLWVMGTSALELAPASAFNCFAGETEVLTVSGVKRLKDVSGTTQTILTKGGKWVDAPISSFGEQPLMKVTLSRQGVEKVIYATPEHRWIAKDRRNNRESNAFKDVVTRDLIPNVSQLPSVYGQGLNGPINPSPFGIAQGFSFGDGSTTEDRSANCVHLFGEKDASLSKYFSLCTSYPVPNGTRFTQIPNSFKKLPSLNENSSFLAGWLMGYFAADGSCEASGSVVLNSSDKSNLEFARDVCIRLGIGYYGIREETRISNLTGNSHTMYSLALMRETLNEEFFLIDQHRTNFINNPTSKTRPSWYVVSVEATNRVEEVFCATVPETASFVLEGHILTGNCAFVSTQDIKVDLAEPFTWSMEMLMLGVGVGFDAKGAGTFKVQQPKTTDVPFVVEDSREGWIDAVRACITPYTGKGFLPPSYDVSKVRGPGEPIKGFGGVSSGPAPLLELLEQVNTILSGLVGSMITVTAINDIMNLIGRCVVSGNVRRSAELSLGDATDEEFLNLKNPEVNQERLLHHGWASNNSVYATVGMDYSRVADMTAKNGEPGYVWLDTCQKQGRLKDPVDNKDYRVTGVNPCAEITLDSYETCNIVETFPSNHETLEDYLVTLKYAYLYAKTVTLLKTHSARTNAVIQRNRRIGCSMSGITQAINKFGRRRFFEMCDKSYGHLKELDREYSDWLCIPRSIKISTVKPSGSVSLLSGNTPGIHYPHAEYYIRRIRFQESSPLLSVLEKSGYPIETDVYSPNTKVVSFPIKEQFYSRGKLDVSMWEQLETAANMQYYWADNSVSITVTVKPEEMKDIKYALEMYETRLKTVSFLPLEDHKYQQAPYQSITREEYEAMASHVTPITSFGNESTHEVTEVYCTNDVCEIRPVTKSDQA